MKQTQISEMLNKKDAQIAELERQLQVLAKQTKTVPTKQIGKVTTNGLPQKTYKDLYDDKGLEKGDPVSQCLPVDFRESDQPSLQDKIIQTLRSEELRRHVQKQGFESLDEADDFDVDDEFDPTSPWELEFDPQTGKQMLKAEKKALDAYRATFDKELKNQMAMKEKPQGEPKPGQRVKSRMDAKDQEIARLKAALVAKQQMAGEEEE